MGADVAFLDMRTLVRQLPLVLAFALLAGALLSSCNSETTTEPADKPVTLDISTKSLSLVPSDTTEASTMTLSCGCGFLLDSIHYTGDTSAIHFTSRDTLSLARHTQTVRATYSPSNSPVGSHSAAIDFIVFHTYRGVSYVYYDTITASVR